MGAAGDSSCRIHRRTARNAEVITAALQELLDCEPHLQRREGAAVALRTQLQQ